MLKLCSFWIYKSGGKWRKKRDDKKIDFHYGKKQKFKFHIQSNNIKILNCYDFFEGLLLSISDKFHFLNFIQSGLQNQLPAFLFSSKWKRRGGGGVKEETLLENKILFTVFFPLLPSYYTVRN